MTKVAKLAAVHPGADDLVSEPARWNAATRSAPVR